MRNKPWMAIPLAFVVTLGMSGCDSGENDAPAAQSDDVQQEAPVAQPEESGAISREGRDGDAASAPEAESQPAPADGAASMPESNVGTEESTTPGSTPDSQEPPLGSGDDTSAYSLGNPDDEIEDSQAMPGSVSKSDIDEFMEETERRFEEAQREIDKQFEEAESEDPTRNLNAAPSDEASDTTNETQRPPEN
ncbi:hypothetical protein FGL86_16090 [Pistricoccus aurantiacus]|uniref:Uncharacterized protein n=1 Tax=Pistricoccus aurantiacus TaxID=1883414 RepID=A0A5B8SWG7_9GAMM|nr:hypothetical protein [Pistricoccus aurantiacus]QEA40444.1 hypothetical protein FGL86_16090 [Pistricoccus aurantiacus]